MSTPHACMVFVLAAAGAVATATTHKPDPPGSSDVLALLPDGEMKRSFILDCTGCHQMDVQRAYVNGRARTRDEWRVSIERMLQMAGPTTGFPVISARVEPAALAAWLADNLRALPTAAARVAHPTALLREYDYPYAQDLPHDLLVDAHGDVVITGMFTHRMLVLNPQSGEYREVPIPLQGANPRAHDIGPDGRWWVLLGGPQQVAEYEPKSGAWKFHRIGMYPHSVRLDARGRVWFNGHFTNDPERIGYVDSGTGEVQLFDLPTPPELSAPGGPIPYGLRVAPDGTVWGTELQGNRLFRFSPDDGSHQFWTLPTTHSGPRRMDIGPDGVVWIPAYSANTLVRFDPRTQQFQEIALPARDLVPYVVRVDQRSGRVWTGTSAGDAMLSYDPARAHWEVYPVPTRGALIRHIAIDPRNGEVWAAYGASPGIPPKILRLQPR